jgi:Na+-translocating ferredoxin:NAD+ oxidoreductase RnfC subunit
MSHWTRGCPLESISGHLRAMSAAVEADALDDAIGIGLLAYVTIDEQSGIDQTQVCDECAHHDRIVVAARDARLRALAARARFRAREARLAARAEARAKRRAEAQAAPRAPAMHALPPAAAAAFARAMAKASTKREG